MKNIHKQLLEKADAVLKRQEARLLWWKANPTSTNTNGQPADGEREDLMAMMRLIESRAELEFQCDPEERSDDDSSPPWMHNL